MELRWEWITEKESYLPKDTTWIDFYGYFDIEGEISGSRKKKRKKLGNTKILINYLFLPNT